MEPTKNELAIARLTAIILLCISGPLAFFALFVSEKKLFFVGIVSAVVTLFLVWLDLRLIPVATLSVSSHGTFNRGELKHEEETA